MGPYRLFAMNPSVPPPPSAAPPDPAGTPIAADAAHVESLRPVAYLELKAAMLLLFTLLACDTLIAYRIRWVGTRRTHQGDH